MEIGSEPVPRCSNCCFLLPFVRRRALLDGGRARSRWPNDCDLTCTSTRAVTLTFHGFGGCICSPRLACGRAVAPPLGAGAVRCRVNFIRPLRPSRSSSWSRASSPGREIFLQEQPLLAGGRLCAVALSRGCFCTGTSVCKAARCWPRMHIDPRRRTCGGVRYWKRSCHPQKNST